MIKISNKEAAVLGLLNEHHHYAYRLEEIIQKRMMSNWADVEFGSIDSILNILEEKELVESKLNDINDKSSINVYYITHKGRIVLKRKVKSLLSKKTTPINPFDLGLSNINVLSSDEIIHSLEVYLKSIEEHIKNLEESVKVQEDNNVPYNFIAIYSRSVSILKGEKSWVEKFMEKIRQ